MAADFWEETRGSLSPCGRPNGGNRPTSDYWESCSNSVRGFACVAKIVGFTPQPEGPFLLRPGIKHQSAITDEIPERWTAYRKTHGFSGARRVALIGGLMVRVDKRMS
jgi:hypothetical protein